ncbi:MAG: hypothetical protein A2073_07890 [Deltaproteobacteria bacterium GWC2_42_11]|nr:MAG: hypothetical protein A2073_07890 [Deltaproteobacteria bacterium GWC2_42_11]HBO84108.1 efflux RND transporter periplasmic adaptor subunit [Deltaproteobacteria bacterium]
MIKKIIVFLIIAAVLGGAWFFVINKNTKDIKYRTVSAERGDIQSSISATGSLNAVTTVLVGSQVSGMIRELYADFNSPVKNGQVIALIDDAPFIARVKQAEANLEAALAGIENAKANIANLKARREAARADIDKAKLAVNDAKRNLDRITGLWREGLVSQKDMDNAQFTYDSQVTQVKSAEANFDSVTAQLNAAEAQYKTSIAQSKQNQASLESAKLDMEHTRIISPVNGIVVSRNVDVGQTVASSFQTPTLFTIAKDLTKMQVNTNVDEADIGNVFSGQDAVFTVDAYPDHTFKGKVSQIRNSPIIVQNVVTYNCLIDVDNTELLLKPGMTANVTLLVSHKENVLKVPNAALRFRPKDKEKMHKDGQGKKVWVLKNGKPAPIPVKTGISDGNYTEITEGDIKEGDEVITETVAKKPEYGKGGQPGIPRFIR